MRISRNNDSAFLRWRRLVIVQDVSEKRDPCIALDRAQIPHVVGLHYRYKTPTGKPREAEPWIMVPFQNYSAACSLLFHHQTPQSSLCSCERGNDGSQWAACVHHCGPDN